MDFCFYHRGIRTSIRNQIYFIYFSLNICCLTAAKINAKYSYLRIFLALCSSVSAYVGYMYNMIDAKTFSNENKFTITATAWMAINFRNCQKVGGGREQHSDQRKSTCEYQKPENYAQLKNYNSWKFIGEKKRNRRERKEKCCVYQ